MATFTRKKSTFAKLSRNQPCMFPITSSFRGSNDRERGRERDKRETDSKSERVEETDRERESERVRE